MVTFSGDRVFHDRCLKAWYDVENPPSTDSSTLTNNCSICLDDIESSVIMWTACFHPFHDKCITTWLKRSDKLNRVCPVCRTPLTSTQFAQSRPGALAPSHLEIDIGPSDPHHVLDGQRHDDSGRDLSTSYRIVHEPMSYYRRTIQNGALTIDRCYGTKIALFQHSNQPRFWHARWGSGQANDENVSLDNLDGPRLIDARWHVDRPSNPTTEALRHGMEQEQSASKLFIELNSRQSRRNNSEFWKRVDDDVRHLITTLVNGEANRRSRSTSGHRDVNGNTNIVDTACQSESGLAGATQTQVSESSSMQPAVSRHVPSDAGSEETVSEGQPPAHDAESTSTIMAARPQPKNRAERRREARQLKAIQVAEKKRYGIIITKGTDQLSRDSLTGRNVSLF